MTFAIAREAIGYMEEHRNGPFFLFVPFSAPHTPFQAPKAYSDRFAHVDDPNKRIYYAMIAALDEAVGEITAALETMGLSENTLLWFASDNGGATYTGATENAPLKGGKFNHFEGGVNIPCMVQWPDTIPSGSTMTAPVTLMDVFNTSAAAAQFALPNDVEFDGVDLMPALRGESDASPHDAVFWRAHHMKAARWQQWKWIADTRDGREWLYDLSNDKEERENRIQDHPDVVRDIRERVENWESTLAPARWPYLVEYRFNIDGETFDYPL